MNYKLFVASLVASCFLFLSAGKACAFDKSSFNVLNVPKVLEKQIFNISADSKEVYKDCYCKGCDCGCKETGKCKCGEKCPCDCGCGKSGKCECKKSKEFPHKDLHAKHPANSYRGLYNHVEKGGKGILYLGVMADGWQEGIWAEVDSLGNLPKGIYDCWLDKDGTHLMQIRNVITEAPKTQSTCPNCPNYVNPFGIPNQCPNGKCPPSRK